MFCTVVVMYYVWSGALESPDLLLSYSIITSLTSLITIILIITHSYIYQIYFSKSTNTGTITTSTEIHYDPDPKTTVVEEDAEFVDDFFLVDDTDVPMELMSPWVLRIVLNETQVGLKKLSLKDIATKITEFFMNSVHVVHPDDNYDGSMVRS